MAKLNSRRKGFSKDYSRAYYLIISILMMTGAAIGHTKYGNETCLAKNQILICHYDIPAVVHNDSLDVYIKQYAKESINRFAFDDNSWKNVKSLTIEVNRNINLWYIDSRTFQSLGNLKRLTFYCKTLVLLDDDAFVGLNEMTHVNLSGSIKLNTTSLISALQNIRSIQTLILDELGSINNRLVHIGPDFFNMIRGKGVQTISLSKVNVYFERITQNIVPLPFVELNISHSQIFFQKPGLTLPQLYELLRNVKLLDISGIDERFFRIPRHEVRDMHRCDDVGNLALLEQINANNINFMEGNVTGIVRNISLCQLKTKVIQMRSCGIRILNVTMYLRMDNALVNFDLSKNGMEIFSIKGHMPVSTLNLAYNNIQQMQTSPEFSTSMHAFPLLEDVNLENNGLTYLPKYIFLRNRELKYIRLGGNYLTKVDIDIDNLHNLRYLDLQNNRIKLIDTPLLVVFDNLQNMQANLNRTSGFVVNIKNNEIECSCRNSRFVEWIVSKTMHRTDHLYHVSCHSDGRKTQVIDKDTLKHVQFLCKRPLLIIISSIVCAVGIFLLIAMVLVFMRMKSKKNIDNFIRRFKNRKTKEKFLALISHSKEDSQIVYNGIRQHLERAMRKVVPVDFDLLCLGDIHFRPGMAIVDEIHKSVSESGVAIFVVSRAFCESSWCRMEVKEAYGQSKPIILMFLEEVDTQNMTPLVKNIFSKNTRVKITKEHGNVTIVPSWDFVAHSILDLIVMNEPSRNRLRICFI